jgi:hypothetical protein
MMSERQRDSMDGETTGQRGGTKFLHRLFIHLAARPQLSYEAADRWLELNPETREVLSGALRTLWRTLNEDSNVLGNSEEPTPMTKDARRELLVQAGMLRGINLALITNWRPSADTVEELEALYGGSVALLATFSQMLAVTLARSDATYSSLAGTREYVLKINERAKQALSTAIMVGYGTGFLVSDALDLTPELTDGILANEDPAATVGIPALPVDSAEQVRLLELHADALTPTTVREELRILLEEPRTHAAAERAMLEVSRYHPVSVPRNAPHYSVQFVEDMLTFLLRWWLGVGLRVHVQILNGASSLPAEREALDIYQVGRWLTKYSRRWARSAANQFLADSAEPERSREHVFTLIQTALVSGRWLAMKIDAGASGNR